MLDKACHLLTSITRLKSRLSDFIEPDFGLLDHLLSLQLLKLHELAAVRCERTVYLRNDALLDLLTTEDQCDKFLKALQRTGQQHVVNFITQNGGQIMTVILHHVRMLRMPSPSMMAIFHIWVIAEGKGSCCQQLTNRPLSQLADNFTAGLAQIAA